MQRDQAMVAPVPALQLVANVLREQLFARHVHGGRRVDGAGDEVHTGGAAAVHPDLLDLRGQPHRAAAGLDDARQRQRQGDGAADRQREAHDVREDGGKHHAGAGLVFGGDDVHVRREQRADAVVVEMLAHHAEQVVLGVR